MVYKFTNNAYSENKDRKNIKEVYPSAEGEKLCTSNSKPGRKVWAQKSIVL